MKSDSYHPVALSTGPYWIAVKDGKATVVKLNLSPTLRPSLPQYAFIGPYSTSKQAETAIPHRLEKHQ